MTKEFVQIIYLNGPSSSGKTTLAKALQQRCEKPFLHVGIDKIIGWMPEKLNDWTGGEAPIGYSWKKSENTSGYPIAELQVGPYAQKIGKTFQEVVVMLAKMGHHIIIDDVSFGKQQLDEWKKILKDFQVLWVGVNAPLTVLEQREKQRGNRMVGSARDQFYKVHLDANYDLQIDTHKRSIHDNVRTITSKALRSPKFLNNEKYGIQQISTTEQIQACYTIMRQLRPHLVEEQSFIEQIQRQLAQGYKLACWQEKGKVRALIGFRFLEFLAWGKVLYIDDLITDLETRKNGYGGKLLKWVIEQAKQENCDQVHLDSGPQRYDAHRLYLNHGFKIIAHHFALNFKDISH